MDLSWGDIKDILEALSYIVVIAGVPAAIWQYRNTSKKEQIDREQGTYDALDNKFIEFHNICLAYPDLGIDDTPRPLHDKNVVTGPVQDVQRRAAFTILISMFERAYLMYHDHSDEVKMRQWSGWDEYLRYYLRNAYFRDAAQKLSDYWDKDFQSYLDGVLAELESGGTA